MSDSKADKKDAQPPTLTTSFGAPVDDNQNSLTAGQFGPILLQDLHLIEKLAHFDRERIPERVVHAKGAGAHGYFEVTHDVTKFTKAKFLSAVKKRTPVFVRFSTVGGEKASSDCARDARGFAIKHHTEEGIYDMAGINTPAFSIRDPVKFPDLVHSQKKNPQTNLHDASQSWDFPSLVPEAVHQWTMLYTDRGTPLSYRHMSGFGVHTFKWVNAAGEGFWVKLHYKPKAGIKNMTRTEAAAADPDHATADLFNHIASGKTAEWTAYAQIMPVNDAAKYAWNVFDPTKVWLFKDYPLIEYGKLVLDRNPQNYFAEVEQSAFSPSMLVPGIEPSPDRVLQGRLFSYPDTQRHRLGANYLQIPINCPYASKVTNQQRDGPMTVNANGGAEPNYEPNSVAGSAKQAPEAKLKEFHVGPVVARFPQVHPNSDFEQTGSLYRLVLKQHERDNLIDNIVDHLKHARKDIQTRMVEIFTKCDKEYGQRVADGLLKASGSVQATDSKAGAAGAGAAAGTFTLPALPYARDALAPHISAVTIDFHYGKHHAGYVNALNDIAKTDAKVAGKTVEELVQTLDAGRPLNMAAQVWNHTFYWHSMSPSGGGEPKGAIAKAIDASFGSFAKFKDEFSAAAGGHFGNGWAWLVLGADGKLKVHTTHDAGSPLTKGAATGGGAGKPLLTCDVWEHAYYLDRKNARADYIKAWWNVINWDFASHNLEKYSKL